MLYTTNLINFGIPHQFFNWIFCVKSISSKYLKIITINIITSK